MTQNYSANLTSLTQRNLSYYIIACTSPFLLSVATVARFVVLHGLEVFSLPTGDWQNVRVSICFLFRIRTRPVAIEIFAQQCINMHMGTGHEGKKILQKWPKRVAATAVSASR